MYDHGSCEISSFIFPVSYGNGFGMDLVFNKTLTKQVATKSILHIGIDWLGSQSFNDHGRTPHVKFPEQPLNENFWLFVLLAFHL